MNTPVNSALQQVLFDDVADVLQVDGERNDLHRPSALGVVETFPGQPREIELDACDTTVQCVRWTNPSTTYHAPMQSGQRKVSRISAKQA